MGSPEFGYYFDYNEGEEYRKIKKRRRQLDLLLSRGTGRPVSRV